MKLIDLLVKELPKRGGWPDGADECYWHSGFSNVCFYNDGSDVECSSGLSTAGIHYNGDDDGESVTLEQYEAAIAASKAVVGNNGWIQWAGGECPVDSDAIVEVKYRKPSPYQFNNDRAGDFTWSHDGFGGDIIAYRLQQPTKSEHACDDAAGDDDESDLNECIGQDVGVPEWNGEGMPPAGCKCEVMESNPLSVFDKWTSCTVIHFNLREGRETQVCIIDGNGDFAILYGNDGVKFRPLRTEAERKREAEVKELLDAINLTLTDIYSSRVFMDAIHEGKIPGVKLESK